MARIFLLDTNVVSEVRKKRPSQQVVEWLAELTNEQAFLSVITIGEIARGIAKRRRIASERRAADELQAWLDGLLAAYADRIIHIDVPIATRWGRLTGQHPNLSTDMLIAASALERNLTVATRNVPHFKGTGAEVFNPF